MMKIFLTFILLSTNVCFGQNNLSYRGPINDFEELVSDGLEKRLNKKIEKKLNNLNIELLIFTTSNLNKQLTVPRYLGSLFNQWGKTKSEMSKMIVLFVSKTKSKVEIFIGNDAKSIITKKQKNAILEDVIEPKIKDGNYKSAIKNGIKAILKYF